MLAKYLFSVPNALYTYISFLKVLRDGDIVIFIIQMEKLMLRKVESLSEGEVMVEPGFTLVSAGPPEPLAPSSFSDFCPVSSELCSLRRPFSLLAATL